MLTGVGLIIVAILAALAGYCFARQFERPSLPSHETSAWGDVVELHPEARWTAARKRRGGGSAEQGQPSVTLTVIAHDRGIIR